MALSIWAKVLLNIRRGIARKITTLWKEPWNSCGLRAMPVDNYLVFYILDKDLCMVAVIRVMYEEVNVENHLNNHMVI